MLKNKNELSFEEKLNSNQIREKAISLVNKECCSKQLLINSKISKDEVNKLVELAYTLAFFENYVDIKVDRENFEDSFYEVVQSMLDIISKYILNKVMKRGL